MLFRLARRHSQEHDEDDVQKNDDRQPSQNVVEPLHPDHVTRLAGRLDHPDRPMLAASHRDANDASTVFELR